MRKTGIFFSSNFHDSTKVMPVIFGETKMSLWLRKKAGWYFRKGNSSSYICVITFLSLELSEV